MDWSFKIISGNHNPRQFEYHPTRDELLFGTIYGEIFSVNTTSYESKGLGYFGKNKNDAILGICWLKSENTNHFITGSSLGKVYLGTTSTELQFSSNEVANSEHAKMDIALDYKTHIVKEYSIFDRLTSVHVNCNDRILLLSGYATSIGMFDIETGVELYNYQNIHQDHINISRFSNQSPHLFATSSFDGTIKAWDIRLANKSNSSQPIYTINCKSGIVMINFSNDDNFILASAVDNEINQYLFMNGDKHLNYKIASTGLEGNFSRAYYSASGSHVIAGSCEESTVKMLCAYSGENIANIEIYPQRRDKSLYIQSLRANPCDDNEFCVLVSYRDIKHRELVMVKADIKDKYFKQETNDHSRMIEDSTATLNEDENCTTNITSNNIFYQFHSSKYINDLRKLCILTREIDLSYMVSIPINKDDSMLHELDVIINYGHSIEVPASGIRNESTSSNNLKDIVLLTHVVFESTSEKDDHLGICDTLRCFVYPIHSFIIAARCSQLLVRLSSKQQQQQQQISQVQQVTPLKSDQEISTTNKIQIKSTEDLAIIDISPYLKFSFQNYLLPLLIEYFYIGNNAIDLMTIRYYSLLFYVEQTTLNNNSEKTNYDNSSMIGHDRPIDNTTIHKFSIEYLIKILLPLLDPILQLDIQDTFQNNNNELNENNIRNEILLKVGMDDYTWNQCQVLNLYFIRTIRYIIELAIALDLKELKIKVIQLLEYSLCLANVRFIYKLALDYEALELRDLCLVFISNHQESFDFNDQHHRPELLFPTNVHNDISIDMMVPDKININSNTLLAQLVDLHQVDVISLKEFSNRKALIDMLPPSFRESKNIMNASEPVSMDSKDNGHLKGYETERYEYYNKGVLNKNIDSYYSPLSNLKSIEIDPDMLCLHDEMPFLPGTSVEASNLLSSSNSSICLPRYIYVASCRMLKSSIIFLGVVADRISNLSTRILSYNFEKDQFTFLQGHGTYLFKTGNFIQCFSMQKINPTHMVVLGGRLKSASIASKHTNLLNHLESSTTSVNNNNKPWEPSSFHEEEPITRGMRGIEVSNNDLINTIQNKTSTIWNQASADFETSISSNSNFLKVKITHKNTEIASMLNNMGAIYELDFTTMNWRCPVVELLTSSMYDPMALMGSNIPKEQELLYLESLEKSLKCRLASTNTVMYHQDISYQCSKCIFNDYPFVQCFCDKSINSDHIDENKISTSKCWIIQFGGYCSKEEAIKSDLHILVCDKPSSDDSDINISNRSHLRNTNYCYSWRKTRAAGIQPQPRFYHSSVFLPCNLSGPTTTNTSTEQKYYNRTILPLHSRILYYGGVGYGDLDQILSLRINYPSKAAYEATYKQYAHEHEHLNIVNNSSAPRSYLNWEKVYTRGNSPARRKQHSMVLLSTSSSASAGNIMCLLYGGCLIIGETDNTTETAREIYTDELWCLVIHNFTVGLNNNDLEDGIHVYWQKVITSGIPPTPRCRNAIISIPSSLIPFSTVSSKSHFPTIFIFGGSNEIALSNRQLSEKDDFDFDEGAKDSIMHMLQLNCDIIAGNRKYNIGGEWITSNKKSSTFIYYPFILTLPESICTLSRDMATLLDPLLAINDETFEIDSNISNSLQYTLSDSSKQLSNYIQPDLFIKVFPLQNENSDENQLSSTTINCINANKEAITFTVYSSLCSIRCNWIKMALNSNMKESQSNTLHIYHDNMKIIKLFILYLYSDKLLFHSIQDIIGILELSSQYNLELLTKLCEGILIRLVKTPMNAMEFIEYADIFNLNILKHTCFSIGFRYHEFIYIIYLASSSSSTATATAMLKEMDSTDNVIISKNLNNLLRNDYARKLYQMFKSLNIDLQNEMMMKCISCLNDNNITNNVYYTNIQIFSEVISYLDAAQAYGRYGFLYYISKKDEMRIDQELSG